MTQALARPEPQIRQLSIRDRLSGDDFKHAIASVLPKHLTPDRFVRIAILATTRTPKLLECDQASLFNALMTLSQYGLEPDGRRAHLIPFKKNYKDSRGQWKERMECQLIIDYKGLAELIMRSGIVSYIHADVVREGDIFEFNMGEITRHIPWFLRRDADRPASQGERFAAYALIRMKDGTTKTEVMSADDILAIRNRSQGWIAFEKGWAKQSPWDPKEPGIEGEMWKKTAFRRASKWLPLSPELRGAVEEEDDVVTPAEPLKSSPNERLAAVRFASEFEEAGREEGGMIDGDAEPDPSQPLPNASTTPTQAPVVPPTTPAPATPDAPAVTSPAAGQTTPVTERRRPRSKSAPEASPMGKCQKCGTMLSPGGTECFECQQAQEPAQAAPEEAPELSPGEQAIAFANGPLADLKAYLERAKVTYPKEYGSAKNAAKVNGLLEDFEENDIRKVARELKLIELSK